MEIERHPITKQMRFAKIDPTVAVEFAKGSILPNQPAVTTNPLEQAATVVASKFSTKQILWTVLCVGAGVGLTVLVFHLKSKKQKAELENKHAGQILILRTMLKTTDNLSGVKSETRPLNMPNSPPIAMS